ncbi:MAG: LarC family nickel insertion protein [Promethearchaeota archaeon]
MMTLKKIIRIFCTSGISGDMLVGAFHDLLEERGLDAVELVKCTNIISEALPHVKKIDVDFIDVEKHGFMARFMRISIDETLNDHAMSPGVVLENLKLCLSKIPFSNPVKASEFSIEAFSSIASAEYTVHGIKPNDVSEDKQHDDDHHHHTVHLHEIASVDTIIDIVCVARALDILGFFESRENFRVVATPVSVGGGTINIAHGTVPVPAPATEVMLERYNIPFIENASQVGELATPTGVGILAALKPEFHPFPSPVRIVGIGRGAGSKDIGQFPNILKLQLLEVDSNQITASNTRLTALQDSPLQIIQERIGEITTTIDDASLEDVAYWMDKSYGLGAWEVYSTPVNMKKSRTGIEIRILCEAGKTRDIALYWLENTTTLGCRISTRERLAVKREIDEIQVDLRVQNSEFHGVIRVKRVLLGTRGEREEGITGQRITRPLIKIEHDDLERVAQKLGISMVDARRMIGEKIIPRFESKS